MMETLTLRYGASSVTMTEANLETTIKQASVSGNTLTLTPYAGQPITFSRAITSWDLGWSNGTFTAKANPQNQHVTTTLEQGNTSWDDKTVTIWINARNSDHPSQLVGTGEYVTATYSGGGSDYPYSKTLTCTSKNYSAGTWVYTFRYSVNNSSLWNVDQSYTFHHNSGYT